MKAFSDNIIIQYQIPNNHYSNEDDFGQTITTLIQYQNIFLQHGFLIRGAWDIGKSYCDKDIVYGMPLLNAYKLESTQAVYPRIIFSEEMKKLIHQHLEFYSSDYTSPQETDILQDENKIYFVNYLTHAFEYDYIDYEYLAWHKNIIENKIEEYKQTVYIKKYEWLAFYHNFFCSNCFYNGDNTLFSNLKINNYQKDDSWKIDFIIK